MASDTGPRPPASSTRRRRVRTAARATVAGVVLYVLVVGALHLLPPHYDPISQPESDYAVGPYGALMTAAFVLRGLLSLSFCGALVWSTSHSERSTVGVECVAAWAAGAFLLAAFPTDVDPARPTTAGRIHLVVALAAFAAMAAGSVLVTRRLRRSARSDLGRPPALALAVCSVAAFGLLVGGAVGTRTTGVLAAVAGAFGLVERAFLLSVLLWMALLARRLSERGRLSA